MACDLVIPRFMRGIHSCDALLQTISQFCLANPANTYWIAYSGGLDSHVLLALFAKVREASPIHVRAIHIHHGLSKNADAWSQHCAAVCAALQINFATHTIFIDTTDGKSLEEKAREQRYAIFASLLQAGDILITAHHQNDQAETVLLQLLRGAGVKGLSAMPMVKSFANAQHARPLLSFTRAQLLEYAQAQPLQWIEDESNQNKKFMRNFIRHDLMPLLYAREPAAAQLLTRSAAHCAEAQSLLEEYAAIDLAHCAGSRDHTLSVQQLNALSPARQRLVLRSWIHARGFRLPDHRRLEAILRNVLTAGQNRMPCVRWGDVALRRYGDDLFVMSIKAEEIARMKCFLFHPGNDTSKNVIVKFRTGGEVVPIPGRGTQSLKNLFQEWRVPPWERDQIPLLYVNEDLIAVVGYFLHPDFSYLQLV
jgi:tRNA(Ile)-lysidine synthase